MKNYDRSDGRPRAAAKRGLQSVLRRAGLEIHRAAPPKPGTVDAFVHAVLRTNCSLVLDVGANEGEFVNDLRQRGYEGDVISFEPRRKAFARLERLASRDPLWLPLRFALGSEACDVPINISGNGVSSSVLPMESLHVEAAPDSKYVAVEQVPQRRLDDVVLHRLDEDDVVAIKLDVQGFEAAVLEGSPKLLDRTVAVHLELSLAPVYREQADWRELAGRLRRIGFDLWAVEPVLTDRASGRTLQVDVVMCRA